MLNSKPLVVAGFLMSAMGGTSQAAVFDVFAEGVLTTVGPEWNAAVTGSGLANGDSFSLAFTVDTDALLSSVAAADGFVYYGVVTNLTGNLDGTPLVFTETPAPLTAVDSVQVRESASFDLVSIEAPQDEVLFGDAKLIRAFVGLLDFTGTAFSGTDLGADKFANGFPASFSSDNVVFTFDIPDQQNPDGTERVQLRGELSRAWVVGPDDGGDIPAVVPLPAGVFLLGGALGALGLARRRRA